MNLRKAKSTWLAGAPRRLTRQLFNLIVPGTEGYDSDL